MTPVKKWATCTAEKCEKDQSRSVKVSAEDRFVFDIDDEELSNMKDGMCPSNTLKTTEQ